MTFSPVVRLTYVTCLGVFVWAQFQAVPQLPWIPVLVGALLLVLPALFGRLVFRVDEESVTATFGYFGWPSQRVALAEIFRARPVDYRPIRTFGGWGIRSGQFEGEPTGVYSVRGNEGVLLELSSPRRVCASRTRRFLLGTAEPDRLAAAIGKP